MIREWTFWEVRPIQMGELVGKYVSRRLWALSEGEVAAFKAAMRQLGVDSQRRAEALAIFHQLIFDEWASGTLDQPPARIKVDEKFVLDHSMGCCAKLGKLPSPKARSSGWLETSCSLPLWNKVSCRCQRIVVQSKETWTVP